MRAKARAPAAISPPCSHLCIITKLVISMWVTYYTGATNAPWASDTMQGFAMGLSLLDNKCMLVKGTLVVCVYPFEMQIAGFELAYASNSGNLLSKAEAAESSCCHTHHVKSPPTPCF